MSTLSSPLNILKQFSMESILQICSKLGLGLAELHSAQCSDEDAA